MKVVVWLCSRSYHRRNQTHRPRSRGVVSFTHAISYGTRSRMRIAHFALLLDLPRVEDAGGVTVRSPSVLVLMMLSDLLFEVPKSISTDCRIQNRFTSFSPSFWEDLCQSPRHRRLEWSHPRTQISPWAPPTSYTHPRWSPLAAFQISSRWLNQIWWMHCLRWYHAGADAFQRS